VRRVLFDSLTSEQLSELAGISEALLAATGGAVPGARTGDCLPEEEAS
jgi:hypothetical protein